MMKSSQYKSILWFLPIIRLLMLFSLVNPNFGQDIFNSSCKTLPNGITLKNLEDILKKLLAGESAVGGQGALECRDAVPVLKKYALDPDPDRRRIVTTYLGSGYSSIDKLKVLTLQIQTFPLEKNKATTFYARRYPCYYFKEVNKKHLSEALIARIKASKDNYNGDEIYILGCLSRRNQKAKDYLLEMWQPSYHTQLGEEDRQNQRKNIFYALAESGQKDAEEKVLSDISEMTATTNSNKIQSILDDAKSFTNCRIIKYYVSLIEDTREISKDEYQDGEIKQLKGRIGDMAISQFMSIYGTKVTGEKDVGFRAHSDEELEKIYGLVKSFVKREVINSCKLED